jgi:hypothetical protein
MSGYTIFEATEKTAESYRDLEFARYTQIKEQIAMMEKRGEQTFMTQAGSFQSNKQGLLANPDVFISDDRVLYVGEANSKPPKGFKPLETIETYTSPDDTRPSPQTPRS